MHRKAPSVWQPGHRFHHDDLHSRPALVNLRFCQVREAGRDNALHGLPVLQEPDHVMNANAGTFDEGVSAANAGFPGNIAVGFRDRAHR